MRDWHMSRDCLLQEEFPNTVTPLDISFDTEEKYKNSIIKMIDLNETLTVRNEETEKNNNDEITNIVQNIENYDFDFFVNMALKTPEPYVIALIMYKQNYQNIYLKRIERNVIHQKTNKIMKFKDMCWVYKDSSNDTSSSVIVTNLRKMISTTVSDIFIEKIKERPNEYQDLTEIILKLRTTMFKTAVMKKLENLFRM
jgi:hypothetical protein